jgi:lambda repressor-like predicted transcriptional regulator
MKPHKICKKAGLKSLTELSEKSGVSIKTLNNWSKNSLNYLDV